ncbi:MAG: pyridoxamine 5'-phosphate oxidase family protein [Clostridia bacterium]|nr:pyridoxamine 5'-phosphate oxidase family protein [Clostridia bacterium]
MITKLTDKQIELAKEQEWVILSTTNKDGKPHSIIVQPSRIESDKIILSNIQMKTSIDNLKENNKCFINIFLKENDDMQIKIDGIAKLYDSGKLYENIKEYEETNNLPPKLKVNSIIVIDFKNIEISNG